MITKVHNVLFEQIVDIAYDYLGPAARRFIAREVETHLHKKPEKITSSDIPVLLDWSRLAIALMTDDKSMVDDFSRRLTALTERDEGQGDR